MLYYTCIITILIKAMIFQDNVQVRLDIHQDSDIPYLIYSLKSL